MAEFHPNGCDCEAFAMNGKKVDGQQPVRIQCTRSDGAVLNISATTLEKVRVIRDALQADPDATMQEICDRREAEVAAERAAGNTPRRPEGSMQLGAVKDALVDLAGDQFNGRLFAAPLPHTRRAGTPRGFEKTTTDVIVGVVESFGLFGDEAKKAIGDARNEPIRYGPRGYTRAPQRPR